MSDDLQAEIDKARKVKQLAAQRIQEAEGMYAAADAWLDHLLRQEREEATTDE